MPTGSEPAGNTLDWFLARIRLVEHDDGTTIEVDQTALDLIEMHPELLSPDVDATLAQRQEAADGAEQRHLAAARQVLEACRQPGSLPAEHGIVTGGDTDDGGLSARDDLLAFVHVASTLGAGFSDQGVLGTAMAVARALVLVALMGKPGINHEATREAALTDFEALSVLWHLAPSRELAGMWYTAGTLWMFRQLGERDDNQERAIACFETTLSVVTREIDANQWAAALYSLGDVYQERLQGVKADNQDRAIACYEAALTVFAPEDDADRWALVQYKLGMLYHTRLRNGGVNNQECALICFKAALSIFTREHDSDRWAAAQNWLGNVYRERLFGARTGNQENAIVCYKAALLVHSRQADPRNWAQTKNNLGVIYAERLHGERDENQESAIAYYEAALTVRTEETDPHNWAQTQNNLGILYAERLRGARDENQERAIACYKAALGVFIRKGDTVRQASTLNNLAVVYAERLLGKREDNQERAITCYEDALVVRTRGEDPYNWAMTHNNLGNVYQQRLLGKRGENEERALACYSAALTVFTHDADPHNWAMTQNNRGSIYAQRLRGKREDNQEDAVACYRDALTVRTRDADPHNWAGTLCNLGLVYAERLRGARNENEEHAIACFSVALPLLRLIHPFIALHACIMLGSLQMQRGRTAAARSSWGAALSLREQLLTPEMGKEMRHATARRSRDLAAQLALVDSARGRHDIAIATLEHGRALALREVLGLDAAWLARIDHDKRVPVLAAQIHLDGLRKSPPQPHEGPDPTRLRRWEASILAAKSALAAAMKAAGYQRLPSLDAPALATLAPSGGAVALLAAAEDGGGAYLLSAGSMLVEAKHYVPLITATTAKLQEQLSIWLKAYSLLRSGSLHDLLQLRSLLSTNAALEGVLERLWGDVMAPVLERLPELGLGPGAPLVLLPQGDLALLPLHAAGRRVDGRWRCVLDDHEVSYAPSGYVLRTAHERLVQRQAEGSIDATGRGYGLFGAFNPMRGDKRHELPLAEAVEMPVLRGLFERLGQPAVCCVGQDEARADPSPATVERVLAEAPAGGYVHFACHGRFDLADPEASGLQLAKGEQLTVPMIVRDLRLPRCRLVTLSACETGMVDVQHLPDEFVGLPAAFLQAGAPGVVATFWSVLAGPTAAVMTRFYALHLEGEGMRPAAALRRAVLDLRDLGQDETDPAGLRPLHADQIRDLPGEDAAAPAAAAGELLPPELRRLCALPIVWAAFAHHGI